MVSAQQTVDSSLCHTQLNPGTHPWNEKRIPVLRRAFSPGLPMSSSWGLASFNNNASLLTIINLSLTDARINKLVSWKYITGKGSSEELQDQKSALVVWNVSLARCASKNSTTFLVQSSSPLIHRHWERGSGVLFLPLFFFFFMWWKWKFTELTGVWVTSSGLRMEWRPESSWELTLC